MNVASVNDAQNLVIMDGVGKKIVTCTAPPYANAVYITGLDSAGVIISQELGGVPIYRADESTAEPLEDWWEYFEAPQEDYNRWMFLLPPQNVSTQLTIEIEEMGEIYVGFAQKAAHPPTQIKYKEVRNVAGNDPDLQIQTDALGSVVKISK